MKFSLKDVNTGYYQCGHYPEWKVQEDPIGDFETAVAAEEVAGRRNAESKKDWSEFLAILNET